MPTERIRIRAKHTYPISKNRLARVDQIERYKDTGQVIVFYRVVTPIGPLQKAPLLSCNLNTFGLMVQEAEGERNFEVLKEVEYIPGIKQERVSRLAGWSDMVTAYCSHRYRRVAAYLKMIWNDEGGS